MLKAETNPLFSKLSKEMNQAFVLFPIRTTALGAEGMFLFTELAQQPAKEEQNSKITVL